MRKVITFLFITCSFIFLCKEACCQINVLNINDGRGIYNDYNMFGSFMDEVALPKLQNPQLFGPAGVVKQTLQITNGFGSLNSIADTSLLSGYDIIFVGTYAGNFSAFSNEEVKNLLLWSQQPGKVLMVMEQAVGYTLTKAMGYDIIETYGTANPSVQGPDDAGFTNIFSDGPFGNASKISQAGSSQGSFRLACGAKVLSLDAKNNPAIVFDPYYRDILCGDIGYFTNQIYNSMQNDNTVDTDAERAWCNLWAWAVNEVLQKKPPIILPPLSDTLGKALYMGEPLPLCALNNAGNIIATDTIKGFYLLGWETSVDNGNSWTEINDKYAKISFNNAANNQQYRFITGTDTTKNTSCRVYKSAPVKITVNPVSKVNEYHEVCEGQSYLGHSVNGTFTDTFSTGGRCIIHTLTLKVKATLSASVSRLICEGESFEGHTATGTYIDTLTNATGCDSIRTINLIVKKKTAAAINQSICEGQLFEGYTATGTYIDTFTNAAGCDSIRTINLIVKKKTAAAINQSICEGQSFAGYTATGTYIDTLTNAAGCDSIRTINLIVKKKTFATINQSICKGQSFEGYTAAGTFTDTFINAAGCDSVRTIILKIKQNHPPDLGPDNGLCEGDSIVLNPGQFDSYKWQDATILPQFVVKKPGVYSVTVADSCSVATDEIIIVKRDCTIYFPNAFTPNNDGLNDYFKILNAYNIVAYHLEIYNRWGQKIFETKDFNKGWDGKIKGTDAGNGTYVWQCYLTTTNSTKKLSLHGTVVIVR